MEEDFDINAFIDEHADEDLDTLTIFVPDELKVESDEEEDDLGKYEHEELHRSKLDLVAAIHPLGHKVTRDTAIAVYPTTKSDQPELSYVGSWFDYFTDSSTGYKHCNEVNLYLEVADLSEWPMDQADVVQFDSLKTSDSANARKIYSSLVNRVL
jgi:hypothetical protein